MDSLIYPFTLGMMAAVNPCGFPLLPAYLELFVGGGPGESSNRAARGLRAVGAAAYATAGFVVLFGGLGLVSQLGWSAVSDRSAGAARYLMVAVGVAMVLVGLVTLTGRTVKLPLPSIRAGAGLRRPVAVTLFGLSYGVASIGCALPLFIGGVVAGFGRRGILHGISDLVAYALGMGAVLAVLALGIAVMGVGSGRFLRRAGRLVPIAGGVILVAVGSYLAWYWAVDIVHPGSSFAVERFVQRIQTDISNPIDRHARLVGALLGAAVIAAVMAGGIGRPAPASRRPVPDPPPRTDATPT